MATASFFRFTIPDNHVDLDGFDIRQGEEAFQMVPVEWIRPGFISVSGGPVRIASADPRIVQISSAPGKDPEKVLTFNQTNAGRFALNGTNKPGHTFIVAEDEKGKRLAHLAVSVKAVRNVRYNVVRLRDSLNNTAMSIADTAPILENVEALYRNQTNVFLNKGKTGEVEVKRVLSDKNGVLQLDEVLDNKEVIIFNAVREKNFFDAEVVIVFTWPIEGDRLPFSTTGRKLLGTTRTAIIRSGPTMIYINSVGKGGDSHSQTLAHELGHHFGLGHFGSRPSNFLMDAGARGFKMTQDDINTVNPSGT